ncbi:helix-turn-helix domain-containing protein [Gandjariella thermophila]|uniref:Transcriptional regulator n=1 Tax=Gandjariella thermophila TaxID=1931992 RepID=A0A4D4JB26_9PSEU|nr:helix-turn-helix transcriptional regulator [Gandjariella thermophila]GDY34025.1 transcriptional regulator [Gandjariella thermophila]
MDEGHEVGRRLREIRHWRRQSLSAVAGLSGISIGHLSRIERGERPVTKRRTLEALARALRVSPTELSGRPYTPTDPVSSEARAALNEVRIALDQYELGTDPEVEIRPWPMLAAEVDRLNNELRADYASQGEILPDLLAELHATYVREPARRRDALTGLMYAYYAATCTTKNLGADGFPLVAARHARTVAEELAVPEWLGFAAYLRAYATGQQGRAYQYARCVRTIDQLSAHFDDPNVLQAAGMLHLSAALASAAQGQASETTTHLAEASDLATRVPEHAANFGYLYFTLDNVGIWRVGLHTELGDAGRVTELARDVHPETIPAQDRQGVFYADLGRALACDPQTREQSVQALLQAERIAPQLIRNKPLIRETVSGLLSRAKQNSAGRELRGLAYRMGLAPTG